MLKRKICHIITKLELGGAQQNTLFTVSNINQDEFIPVLMSGKGGILDTEASTLSGVKVYLVDNLIRPIQPISDLIALFKLCLLLRKEKPHIVHTHSSKAGILGRIAAWIARVPVIIHTFHGFAFHDFQPRFVKGFYILLERLIARITHKLIAVSNDNIEKGLQNDIGIREKYLVIRSGIDVTRYKNSHVDVSEKRRELNIPNDEKIITTIGPFKPQKNLLDFVRVAKYVSDRNNYCRFLVIGDGKQRFQIESLINQLKLNSKVELLGWRRDIAQILAVSDVFVMTSLWEGLPRSILEAMCMGLPVVANAVDGVKEIINNTENGFTVEPFMTQEMSECILDILSNADQAKEVGLKAKESITQEYDINYMVKQQEDLYKTLI